MAARQSVVAAAKNIDVMVLFEISEVDRRKDPECVGHSAASGPSMSSAAEWSAPCAVHPVNVQR